MQQFIDSYIATLSGQFFINQVITILLLVIYGVVFVGIIRGKSLSIADYILAYPLSLLAYSISGYFLLSAGIKFNKYSVVNDLIGVRVLYLYQDQFQLQSFLHHVL